MRKLLVLLTIGLLVFSCYPHETFEFGEQFDLEYRQTISHDGDAILRVRFNAVVKDERCPIEHKCLLPGNAAVSLTLRRGIQHETFVLNTYDEPTSHIAFGYPVTLLGLAPQRSLTEPAEPEDYIVTLRIDKPLKICSTDADCGSKDNYCRKEAGDCDGEGHCENLPNICTTEVDPVCGCNGKTYNNACVAATFGVNVAHKGPCDYGYCWSDKECGEDEYCFFKECALETGKCLERPDACPQLYDPVCGCDGKTYANSCVAASQGVSVDHEGECRDSHCDDGSIPACRMMIPQCKDYEILAYQNNCYACVNPDTCAPWGEPGCEKDEDCPKGQRCNMCGSSSCPSCENCVAACTD